MGQIKNIKLHIVTDIKEKMEILRFPNELLKKIVDYSSVKGARSMALTCRRLHEITMPKIWNQALLKEESILLKTLALMSHLPIKELRSSYLKFNWWEYWDDIIQHIPLLQTFHIDDERELLEIKDFKRIFSKSSLAVVFHTKSLHLKQVKKTEELRDALSSVQLKGLAINHCSVEHTISYYDNYRWNIRWHLLTFQDYPLQEIRPCSLWFFDRDFSMLLELLCKKKNCVLLMDRFFVYEEGDGGYQFKLQDMELLVLHKILVPVLTPTFLRTWNADPEVKLPKFIPFIEKLNGLKEIVIEEDCVYDPEYMELFCILPVKSLTTKNFILRDYGYNKVQDVVKVLSKMQHLEWLDVSGGHFNYELTFEEFKMFSHLPVRSVNLDGLREVDLMFRKLEYRELMKTMKIEEIYSSYDMIDRPVHSHGVNGRYKYI